MRERDRNIAVLTYIGCVGNKLSLTGKQVNHIHPVTNLKKSVVIFRTENNSLCFRYGFRLCLLKPETYKENVDRLFFNEILLETEKSLDSPFFK